VLALGTSPKLASNARIGAFKSANFVRRTNLSLDPPNVERIRRSGAGKDLR
jgi:hypothetical protein